MKISMPVCFMCVLIDSVYAPNLLRGSNQNKDQKKYAMAKDLDASTFQDDNVKDNVDVLNKQRKNIFTYKFWV